jgi:5-deoxy-glucuronate isomerase
MTDEPWIVRSGDAPDAPFAMSVTPERAGWVYSGLRILDLAPGASADFDTGDEEMLVVPLSGSVDVHVHGPTGAPGSSAGSPDPEASGEATMLLRGRESVFTGHTDRAYLPIGSSVRMSSAAGGRFALCTARAERRYPPLYLAADRVGSALRGTGRVSRQVVDLANAELCPADRLIVCEVYTPAGGTSSAPPHKHDAAGPAETELEEIYYFELSGSGASGGDGSAGARHATTASDERRIAVDTIVRSGDVALVPYGWHGPTTAPGDADLYYLNVMAGPVRSWQVTFHPTAGPRPDPGDPVDPRLPLVGPGAPHSPGRLPDDGA